MGLQHPLQSVIARPKVKLVVSTHLSVVNTVLGPEEDLVLSSPPPSPTALHLKALSSPESLKTQSMFEGQLRVSFTWQMSDIAQDRKGTPERAGNGCLLTLHPTDGAGMNKGSKSPESRRRGREDLLQPGD